MAGAIRSLLKRVEVLETKVASVQTQSSTSRSLASNVGDDVIRDINKDIADMKLSLDSKMSRSSMCHDLGVVLKSFNILKRSDLDALRASVETSITALRNELSCGFDKYQDDRVRLDQLESSLLKRYQVDQMRLDEIELSLQEDMKCLQSHLDEVDETMEMLEMRSNLHLLKLTDAYDKGRLDCKPPDKFIVPGLFPLVISCEVSEQSWPFLPLHHRVHP